MLGKQEKDSEILQGIKPFMKQSQLRCTKRLLEEKGNFLGIETVKGNFSSLEMVICLVDWRVKSCRVLVLLYAHTRSSEAYLIKSFCFHVVCLIRPLSSFSEFQTKKCLWCVWILLWVVKFTLSKFCSAKCSRSSIAALSRLLLRAWENYSSQRTSQVRHAGISDQD